MRTRPLLVFALGLVSSLACGHKHEISTPASAMSPTVPRSEAEAPSTSIVRGNAPNSDPATDQSILARNVISTGGISGRDDVSSIAGSIAGTGGFGLGGQAGASPAAGR